MINKYNRILLPFFFIIDLAIVICSFYLAYYVRFQGSISLDQSYSRLLFFVIVIWSLSSIIFKTYQEKHGKSLKWHLNMFLIAEAVFVSAIFVYIVATKGHFVSRAFLGLFISLQIIVLFLVHLLRHYLIISYRRKGKNYKRLLVLGKLPENSNGDTLDISNPDYGYKIEDCLEVKNWSVDNTYNFEEMITQKRYDELLITSPSKLGSHIDSVIDIAENNGLRVMVIPEYMKTFSERISIDYFNDKPVINVRYEPLRYLHNRILKRSFDLLFSSVVILLFYWWLHIIIGVLIKISSRGPVIFKQKRVGINSKEFFCYKFRTMVLDEKFHDYAENGFGEITNEEDCRITWIGKILRKTNLDELPQFINIFIGNMSVVGPRPHMLQEDIEIRTKIPKYRIRQFIKPGLTGWAAVNGYRGGTKDLTLMKKRTEHDIWYIENWNFSLDMKIVLLTIWQMVTFKIPNAY